MKMRLMSYLTLSLTAMALFKAPEARGMGYISQLYSVARGNLTPPITSHFMHKVTLATAVATAASGMHLAITGYSPLAIACGMSLVAAQQTSSYLRRQEQQAAIQKLQTDLMQALNSKQSLAPIIDDFRRTYLFSDFTFYEKTCKTVATPIRLQQANQLISEIKELLQSTTPRQVYVMYKTDQRLIGLQSNRTAFNDQSDQVLYCIKEASSKLFTQYAHELSQDARAGKDLNSLREHYQSKMSHLLIDEYIKLTYFFNKTLELQENSKIEALLINPVPLRKLQQQLDEPQGITNIDGNCYLCASLQTLCSMFRALAAHNALPEGLLQKTNVQKHISCAFLFFIQRYTLKMHERAYSHGINDRPSINPGDFRNVLFTEAPLYFYRNEKGEDNGGRPELVVQYVLASFTEKCQHSGIKNPFITTYSNEHYPDGTCTTFLSPNYDTGNTQSDLNRMFSETSRITDLPEILCIRPSSKNISHELELQPLCTSGMKRTKYRLLSIIYESTIHAISFNRYNNQWYLCSDGLIQNITDRHESSGGFRAAVAKDGILYFDQLKEFFGYFSIWVQDLRKVNVLAYERLPEESTTTPTLATLTPAPTTIIPARL